MEEHQEIKETKPQTPPKQKNGSKIAIIILSQNLTMIDWFAQVNSARIQW